MKTTIGMSFWLSLLVASPALGQSQSSSVPPDCKGFADSLRIGEATVAGDQQKLAAFSKVWDPGDVANWQQMIDNNIAWNGKLRKMLADCLAGHNVSSGLVPNTPACSQKASTQQTAQNLQAQIQRDQDAIRRLGFNQSVQDVQEWQALSQKAQADFENQVLDMLLANAGAGAQWEGSLNPPLAKKYISYLRSKGINSGALNAALRNLAATPDKPPQAADVINFLDQLGRLKDDVVTARSVAQDGVNRETLLETLSTVLGWFETDPTLAYLASDLQFATASLYNGGVRLKGISQIDQLTSLSETDLMSLKTLSNQLQSDVSKLNSAKHTLAALSSCP